MTADIPWITSLYSESLTNSSDESPAGFLLFFTNQNFASLYLLAFFLLIVIYGIGHIALSNNKKYNSETRKYE